ncbi:hypothetical protein R75471_00722 [Paraburkholderia domus]|nr:hypothetical protein R75471_00722 [Paraburkholderia domus]
MQQQGVRAARDGASATLSRWQQTGKTCASVRARLLCVGEIEPGTPQQRRGLHHCAALVGGEIVTAIETIGKRENCTVDC